MNSLVAINDYIAAIAFNVVSFIKIVFIERKIYLENFLENLRKIIWNCLPIATLTVSASAIVYSIHVAPEFSQRGLNIYLGGLVALALIREGVPVMGTLAIITQFCSGMTAQIGSMKVTEQLDAMKISKVNPEAYLLVPMLLSGLIGFPVLIVICIFTSIIVNYFFSKFLINISYHLYLSSICNAVVPKDIFLAIIKASLFGFVVTLISYTCGVKTVGGSRDIGNATRLSVVLNFALVIILDYIITALWL